MTELDRKTHAFKRRVIRKGMTSNEEGAESLMLRNIRTFLDTLTDRKQNDNGEWSEAKNVTDLVAYLASDVMGDVTFSRNWNMLNSAENRDIPKIVHKGAGGLNAVSEYYIVSTLFSQHANYR